MKKYVWDFAFDVQAVLWFLFLTIVPILYLLGIWDLFKMGFIDYPLKILIIIWTIISFGFALLYVSFLIKDIMRFKKNLKEYGRFYKIKHKEKIYEFQGKGNYEAFKKWFYNYLPKAPICPSCKRLIFPGDAVGIDSRNQYYYMSIECGELAGFIGHISNDGTLDPYLKEEI